MAAVTVVGLGPMGAAVARALLAAGHELTVWNRTPERADPLVVDGARRADTLGEAVAAAPLVVSCLRDDAAVTETLGPVAHTLSGRTLVDVTSTSPAQARTRAEWAAPLGIDYLTGAIMTPTPVMGTDGAVVLYSGPADVHGAHAATLGAFGGRGVFVGDDPGRASAFDAALLDLFWTAVSGVVHAVALADAEGVTAHELAPFLPAIVGMLPEMTTRFGAELRRGRFPGKVSTVDSADAGLTHLIESSEQHGLDIGVLTASHAVVRRAVAQGHGADGLGRLAAVLRAGSEASSAPSA